MMKYLDISVETTSNYTRSPDPDDDWDYGETYDTIDEVTATLRTASEDESRSGDHWKWSDGHTLSDGDWVDPGTKIYVLIERYSYGSTFGHQTGLHDVRGWYISEPIAWEASKHLERFNGYFGAHECWEVYSVTVQDEHDKRDRS